MTQVHVITSKHGCQIPCCRAPNLQTRAVTENVGLKKTPATELLAVIWGHGAVKITRDHMKVELCATYNEFPAPRSGSWRQNEITEQKSVRVKWDFPILTLSPAKARNSVTGVMLLDVMFSQKPRVARDLQGTLEPRTCDTLSCRNDDLGAL